MKPAGCLAEFKPVLDVVVGDENIHKCQGSCMEELLEIHCHKFPIELFMLAMAGLTWYLDTVVIEYRRSHLGLCEHENAFLQGRRTVRPC